MTTFTKIGWGFSLGVILVLVALYFAQGCAYKKTIGSLESRLSECMTAPVKIHDSIIHDTVIETSWRTPKVSLVHDTAWLEKPKLCSGTYSDTFKYVKGIMTGRIDYDMDIRDCVPRVRFSNIILPVDYRIETKTVQHDTCENHYTPRNHFGLGLGVMMNNFKSFPVFGAGALFTIKDRIGIEPEGIYNPIDGKFYAGGKIFYMIN